MSKSFLQQQKMIACACVHNCLFDVGTMYASLKDMVQEQKIKLIMGTFSLRNVSNLIRAIIALCM